jgi:predicted membrane protein
MTGPVRALIAIAAGVLMIVYNEQAMNLVVKIIAAFLLASGFV